jgi:hypothetical protein
MPRLVFYCDYGILVRERYQQKTKLQRFLGHGQKTEARSFTWASADFTSTGYTAGESRVPSTLTITLHIL